MQETLESSAPIPTTADQLDDAARQQLCEAGVSPSATIVSGRQRELALIQALATGKEMARLDHIAAMEFDACRRKIGKPAACWVLTAHGVLCNEPGCPVQAMRRKAGEESRRRDGEFCAEGYISLEG